MLQNKCNYLFYVNLKITKASFKHVSWSDMVITSIYTYMTTFDYITHGQHITPTFVLDDYENWTESIYFTLFA